MQSVSIVPVGLTKYREGLCKLESFTKEDAIAVIDLVERYQKEFYQRRTYYFARVSRRNPVRSPRRSRRRSAFIFGFRVRCKNV